MASGPPRDDDAPSRRAAHGTQERAAERVSEQEPQEPTHVRLGSRARGPDERSTAQAALAEAAAGRGSRLLEEPFSEEPFSRQAALAAEREAVRVRRYRLNHPATGTTPGDAASGPTPGATRSGEAPAPAFLARLARLWRRVTHRPSGPGADEPRAWRRE